MIRKEAWSFYRTSSGVRLCWELEEPKGCLTRVVGAGRFDLVAVSGDQVLEWVPFLCHYLLACVLVLVASADALYISSVTSRLVWPLKVLR